MVDHIRRNQPTVLACFGLKASYRTIVEDGCHAHPPGEIDRQIRREPAIEKAPAGYSFT